MVEKLRISLSFSLHSYNILHQKNSHNFSAKISTEIFNIKNRFARSEREKVGEGGEEWGKNGGLVQWYRNRLFSQLNALQIGVFGLVHLDGFPAARRIVQSQVGVHKIFGVSVSWLKIETYIVELS